MREIRLIDLFCGAGGMSLGFAKLSGKPFVPVWANDCDPSCVETYGANFGHHCVAGDISGILDARPDAIPHADVVIGGPPCQGFSLLNRDRRGDERRQLWRPFLDVVRESGASAFVMENVPQLLGTSEHSEILETARALGFVTISAKLCAVDYGVPQSRTRAFIVGTRGSGNAQLSAPPKTHRDPSRVSLLPEASGYVPCPAPWQTVRDAIGDLPLEPEGTQIRDVDPPLDLHFGRTPTELSVKRYAAIPEEGMNRFDLAARAPELLPQCWVRKKRGGTDLMGRLWWDRPSFTIRTEFFKPEKGRYLHPQAHRPITHREAARLQSFPDDFRFHGSKVSIARQIGNAVPPRLAAAVAKWVYAAIVGDDCGGEDRG